MRYRGRRKEGQGVSVCTGQKRRIFGHTIGQPELGQYDIVYSNN